MTELPYYNIPNIPSEISTTNAIARLVDGLGFRYRWATEDFTHNEIEFRPVESSMNMMELVKHIYDLAHIANRVFGGTIKYDKTLESFNDFRTTTLHLIFDLSTRLKSMNDSELANFKMERGTKENEYPFWYLLNGPIADALTHVGQITTWRRIAGNPQPKGVNVFLGRKNDPR